MWNIIKTQLKTEPLERPTAEEIAKEFKSIYEQLAIAYVETKPNDRCENARAIYEEKWETQKSEEFRDNSDSKV